MLMAQYDFLIVGAGLYGAAFAHEAKKAGRRCLVVEKRTHTGGNIHCEDADGIAVHRYGAHIFHTSDKEVWDYVTRLADFNRFTNSPLACHKGRLYHLPFNLTTFHELWGVRTPAEAAEKLKEQRGAYAAVTPRNLEEQALKLCGRDIYETLIKGYTEKQWGRPATELPPFIIKRVPLRLTYDNNYFDDRFQGVPVGGYNTLVDALLDGVEVRTGEDYLAHRAAYDGLARHVVFTGCIDAYYDFREGRLDYRSLRFDTRRMETPNFQGNAVINYTGSEVPYTRVIEHKHFDLDTPPDALPHTVVTYEYPDTFVPGKEPYYPVNDDRNSRLYAKYREMAAHEDSVSFGGRLGQYTYADMDDTVKAALSLSRKLLAQ